MSGMIDLWLDSCMHGTQQIRSTGYLTLDTYLVCFYKEKNDRKTKTLSVCKIYFGRTQTEESRLRETLQQASNTNKVPST